MIYASADPEDTLVCELRQQYVSQMLAFGANRTREWWGMALGQTVGHRRRRSIAAHSAKEDASTLLAAKAEDSMQGCKDVLESVGYDGAPRGFKQKRDIPS